jgi:hypothetical protein
MQCSVDQTVDAEGCAANNMTMSYEEWVRPVQYQDGRTKQYSGMEVVQQQYVVGWQCYCCDSSEGGCTVSAAAWLLSFSGVLMCSSWRCVEVLGRSSKDFQVKSEEVEEVHIAGSSELSVQ